MIHSRAEICKALDISEVNTGDTAFQIVTLHGEVNRISQHLQSAKNPKKDKSSLRGLRRKINERTTHMKYLTRTNPERAKFVAKFLGIK